MQLSNLERALLRAANAFIQAYNESKDAGQGVGGGATQQKAQAAPTATSNGIPVCPVHGKAMRLGKYGYHCTAKIGPGDRDYCREKADARG